MSPRASAQTALLLRALHAPIELDEPGWDSLLRRARASGLHARLAAPASRIVVTGASGLVGTQLCALLSTGGHEVTRLVRGPAGSGEASWDPAGGRLDAQREGRGHGARSLVEQPERPEIERASGEIGPHRRRRPPRLAAPRSRRRRHRLRLSRA